MTLERDFFRKVMGQFATGVTIATTRSQAGIAGLTVNSFTSVSLDPFLVMICVDLHSHALPFFRESGVFAVNILSQEQEAISDCFAIPSDERYTFFCHVTYHSATTGSPIIENTLGFIDARITAEYAGGDHAIFLGQVEAMGYNGQSVFFPGVDQSQSTLPPAVEATNHASDNGHRETTDGDQLPLLYFKGKYHHLARKYQHEHADLLPKENARE